MSKLRSSYSSLFSNLMRFFVMMPCFMIHANISYSIATPHFSIQTSHDTIKFVQNQSSRFEYFQQYNGKVIRHITVKTKLSKFSVSNSKPKLVKSCVNIGFKTADFIHFNTRDTRVFDFLLIYQRERIIPEKMVETERILRTNRFFDDVEFIIQNITSNPDSVDVLVDTKDVFSFLPELNYYNSNKYIVGLIDANFLGLAHVLRLNFNKDNKSIEKIRPYVKYIITSPFGNYINFTGEYNTFGKSLSNGSRSENSIVLSAERPYISNLFRWQGGVILGHYTNYDYYNDTTFTTNQRYKYTLLDGWFGLNNYRLSLFNLLKKEWSILYTARISSRYFYIKPSIFDDKNEFSLIDNTNILFQASAFVREYKRFSYLFDLGRMEDIETGKQFSITGGFAARNKNPGYYASLEFQLTEKIKDDQFLNLKYVVGSFFNKESIYDGSALLYTLFTPKKMEYKSLIWRNYYSLSYSHIFKHRYLPYLNGESPWGILDYSGEIALSNKRFALRYEALFFIKKELWGFNFAPLFSTQCLVIHNDSNGLNEIHTSFAMGSRIRNRRWIAKAIDAKIYFYPQLIEEGNQIGFSINTSFDLRSTLNLLHRPEFIPL